MKTRSNRENATLENKIIGADIRNALINEAISLWCALDKGIEGLTDGAMSVRFRFDEADVERALHEGDLADVECHLLDCFDAAQAHLSALEQKTAQLTAALVEFRIRQRTVMKVVERFAGRDTTDLLITNGNGHQHLPVIKEK